MEVIANNNLYGVENDGQSILHQFSSNIAPVGKLGCKVRRSLVGHFGKIYDLQWCPDENSKSVVSASQDGNLIVWDAHTTYKMFAIPLRGTASWVMTCAYAPGGNLVACGGLDNICSIYDVRQCSQQNFVYQPQQGEQATNGSLTGSNSPPSSSSSSFANLPSTSPPSSSTSSTASTPSSSTSLNGKPPNGRIKRDLYGHTSYISCCRFLDEGRILTTSGDGSCILWDVETGCRLMLYKRNSRDLLNVAVSPDHRTFVTGGCDHKATLWDVNSGVVVSTFTGHEADINAVRFFPAGMGVGSASDDGTCRFFDVRASRELAKYTCDDIRDGLISLAFSLSGRIICAGGEDGKCYMWDTLKGDLIEVLDGHKDAVSCLSFSPDGTALCTGGWDSQIKIWA
eukprot:TRINITY_DN1674_c0_g1_i1.p1 TRINITY_DN1674_c0_g1~~TRINITY_DN1674_c0_g1_i1.p1  ORF type:complete len:398 (+),score=72.13 TRINITY_DN1674_c0_g1_i1:72-1265(+)